MPAFAQGLAENDAEEPRELTLPGSTNQTKADYKDADVNGRRAFRGIAKVG